MIFLNWKANGSKQLVEQYNKLDLPRRNLIPLIPLNFLPMLDASKFNIGTQNISAFPSGAYTGEVTAQMLAEFDVKYCLVGHSERRYYMHEEHDIITKKIKLLISSGIKPILCVGESSLDRANKSCFEVLKKQMDAFADGCIVAYEPVWAIGTGSTPSNNEINDIVNWIKQEYEQTYEGPKVLYGGSVSASNVATIAKTDADGILVGGASLKIEDVTEIANYY